MSTTVNAVDQIYFAATEASITLENNAKFDYILALKDTSETGSPLHIYLSQTPFHIADFYYKSAKKGKCITTGNLGSSSANTYAIIDAALTVNGDIILPFDSSVFVSAGTTLGGYVYNNKIGASSTAANRYNAPFCIFNGDVTSATVSTYQIWTNSAWTSSEKSTVNSFSEDLESIGIIAGITDSEVQELIDSALNSTTSASTQVNNIQEQLKDGYLSYVDGEITIQEMQELIDDLTQQLEEINNLPDTTIADKIEISNAINEADLIQDVINKDQIIDEMEEDLTVSSNISAQITGKVNQANNTFDDFTEGTITQSEAMTELNQYISDLTGLITPQTPTADIEAINAAINTITGIKDSVKDYSELDPSVSDEQMASDQEEIEMLNEMISVMQDQVVENKMQDQQVAGKAGDINSVLQPIWENKYMTYLVGVSGVLILACIVLHTKYRML